MLLIWTWNQSSQAQKWHAWIAFLCRDQFRTIRTYITAQRGDKDVVILTRMKNKQIQYMIAFLKVRDRRKSILGHACKFTCRKLMWGRIKNGKWKCWTVLSLQYISSIYLGTSLRTSSFTVKAMILELHQKHHLPYLKCQHSKNK